MAAGNLGQGHSYINDMNTSPVFKTAKKVLLNSQQNTANGNTARGEPHSTGMMADGPGESVNRGYALLLSLPRSSPAGAGREGGGASRGQRAWNVEEERGNTHTHTHGSLWTRSSCSSCEGSLDSRSVSEWDLSPRTGLTFIYIYHSPSFSTST